MVLVGWSRFKLLLDTGTLFVLVGSKAIAFCYVVLALNDLAPNRVRTEKWGRPESLGIGPKMPLGRDSTLLMMHASLSFFSDLIVTS